MRRSGHRQLLAGAVGTVAAATVLALAAGLAPASPSGARPPLSAPGSGAALQVGGKPNIVFFVADDMAMRQLRHLPSTRRLIFAKGARFTSYYTNISLCCPARATLLTGRYAHNTGITGNEYPDGFYGFHTGYERRRTFAVALRRRAGYRTSLLGKYLNEYPFVESAPRFGVRPTFVPHGWSDWAVPVRGQYYGTDYDINLNGRIRHLQAPGDYLGDFLMRRAVRQIEANRDDRGLAMVMSFYGPHNPAPASPIELRDDALQDRIRQIRYPRTPDFNERNVRDKPRWVRSQPRLGPRARRTVDRAYRRQLVSLASIDRHVRVVVRALRRTGQLRNTYLVFTSDNGFHMGSHRLRDGKNTPYLDDVHMPLAIRGPGIPAGRVVRAAAGPMDLAPTFADIAGTRLRWRHDGMSLLPLAKGQEPRTWRRWVLLRRGQPFGRGSRVHDEPMTRLEARAATRMPAFRGVIGARWSYVRYGSGEQELYDLGADPYQLRNIMARPRRSRTAEQVAAVRGARRAVRRLTGCSGVADCRR